MEPSKIVIFCTHFILPSKKKELLNKKVQVNIQLMPSILRTAIFTRIKLRSHIIQLQQNSPHFIKAEAKFWISVYSGRTYRDRKLAIGEAF